MLPALCLALAFGEGGLPLEDPVRSRVTVGLAGESAAEVNGAPAQALDERSAQARGTLLFGGSLQPDRAFPLVQPFLTFEARAARAELPWTSDSHALLRAGAGAGATLGSQGGELYVVTAALRWDGDLTGAGAGALRGLGLGLGTLRLSERVRMLYGVVFGYAFGKGLLLPALGLRWQMAPDWTLAVLVPFEARIEWQAARDLRLGLLAGLAGDRAEIANDGAFPGSSGALALGTRRFQLGLLARLRAASDIAIEAMAGVRSEGRIFLDDGDQRPLDASLGVSGFALLQVSLAFGSGLAR
ncbi:MAG TPA: DUF6268 family outer membrane beta-barrel protein [Myxococcales bacterium]|nr:DUF6268 family outer membrane beta-barrel protein [Myxococcales bacterium]